MEKTILVIDDSPFVGRQICDTVEGYYKVLYCAKNGEEGIEKYKELRPDFVILDIIMPGIDGMVTAKLILKEQPDAKIIMLSSLCDEETMEEVHEIGVKYLLPKPMDPELFLETLMKVDSEEQSL